MKNSYGYLLIIENGIKERIRIQLNCIYGYDWHIIVKKKYNIKLLDKSLEKMYLHEIISLVRMVPELNKKYDQEIIIDLMKLTEIRNKVAHCNVITEEEYTFLYKVYKATDVELFIEL